MRFLLAIVLFPVMAVLRSEESGKNILVNPGFEQIENRFPVGWRNYNHGTKLTPDNLGDENGKWAVVVNSSGKTCGFLQHIKVQKDAKYKIEVSVLFDGFQSGTVTPVYITAMRNQGGPVYRGLLTVKPQDVADKDDWITYSVVLDMGQIADASGSLSVWSIVSGDFTGSAYFDNYSMKEVFDQ